MPLNSLSLYSRVKIRFLSRVLRRFPRSKSSPTRFRSTPSDITASPKVRREIGEESVSNRAASALQRTVKSLHFGDGEEKERAAKEIERLIKDSAEIRKLLVDLGVIPALVAMADSDHLAVRALIELANDSFLSTIEAKSAIHFFRNKTIMVEEGILTQLPKTMDSSSSSSHEIFTELLFSLSSLANTHLFLSSTEPLISFLLTTLNSSQSNPKTKTLCLATLFNISTILENTETLISNVVVVPTLLEFSSTKEFSKKALPTLANLAVTSRGKQALASNPRFAEILIEILTWEEEPKCQELSAYIVMILAHRSSWEQRERLAKSRMIIVPALLGLALLGTPLAQKRALKLLQWFRDERRARVGPHSGPQSTGMVVAVGSAFDREEIAKGKRAMRSLVKESLYKNMEMITRRANANAGECSSSTIKRTLISSTSSKSLPF